MLSRAVLSGLMTMREALVERLQVVVGDHDGDLDEFIHREIETRHLAVDPDEHVGSSHIPSLSRRPDARFRCSPPGRIRTRDKTGRNRLLCPLSYGGRLRAQSTESSSAQRSQVRPDARMVERRSRGGIVARPAFGGRRALSRIGQLLAFAGVVMLVAGFLAFLGGATGPVLDAGARRLIDGAGATGSAVRIQTRLPGDDAGQDAEQQDAAVQQAIDDRPARSPGDRASQRPRRVGARRDRRRARCACRASPTPVCQDAAQLTEGAWPAGRRRGRDAGGRRRPARRRRRRRDRHRRAARSRSSASGRADDPAAARWFGGSRHRLGPRRRRGRSGAGRRVGAGAARRASLRPLDRRARAVRHPALDPRRLGATRSPGSQAEVRRLPTTNNAIELLGTLPDTLARTQSLDQRRGGHPGAAAGARRGRRRRGARADRARDRVRAPGRVRAAARAGRVAARADRRGGTRGGRRRG